MNEPREKLLFVDDERLVLHALRRILEPYQDRWEMVFLDSAVEALQLLERTSFDALITDVRMPQMNGAELLREVMQRYPEMIRIALSGYADRDLMMQCIETAHQYLSKPCDAPTLESVLLRVTTLVRNQRDQPIRELLARCTALPCVPEVYSELVALLGNPTCSVEQIGRIVALDAALSTQMLKLVNSAFFSLGHRINRPEEAVMFIGVELVKALVLGNHLLQGRDTRAPAGFSSARLWSHSNLCAEISQWVADEIGASRAAGNDAYVAGLLHDIGKLLLVANLPDDYAKAVALAHEETITLCAAERRVFGADHAELGGYYLGLLGLPLAVVEAVTHHHQPAAAPHPRSVPLMALHVGNHLAGRERPSNAEAPESGVDPAYVAAVRNNADIDAWRASWLTRESR